MIAPSPDIQSWLEDSVLELVTTPSDDGLTFAKDTVKISSSQRLNTATIIDTVSDDGFDSVMKIQNALEKGVESFPSEFHANDLPRFKSVMQIQQVLGKTVESFPTEYSAKDIYTMLLCLLGFAQNTLLDMLIQPASKANALIYSLPTFFVWMIKTGVAFSLKKGFFGKYSIVSALVTAVIQSSLSHPPLPDAGPYPALPMTPETLKVLRDAGRYIQFSTAAYGVREMAAAEKLLPPMMAAGPIEDFIEETRKKLKTRIAEYLDIDEKDILHLSLPGDSDGIIPHFVAVDNATDSLVLAIRGTNSLTGVCTDANAITTDFCGGKAHSGMAGKANTLLQNEETMKKINMFLENNSKFRLILTGHSLGAGVAGLLSIKLHDDEMSSYPFVKKANIHCFGFGCPPVFAPAPENKASVEAAMSHSTWFINRHDVVPFLSLDSIKLLADVLGKVKAILRNVVGLSPLNIGKWKIPKDLVKEVTDGSMNLGLPISGTRLQIPGKRVLWMNDAKGSGDTRESTIVCCDPSDLANFAIRLSDQFIFDHMTPRYQVRIANLLPSKDEKSK